VDQNIKRCAFCGEGFDEGDTPLEGTWMYLATGDEIKLNADISFHRGCVERLGIRVEGQ